MMQYYDFFSKYWKIMYTESTSSICQTFLKILYRPLIGGDLDDRVLQNPAVNLLFNQIINEYISVWFKIHFPETFYS